MQTNNINSAKNHYFLTFIRFNDTEKNIYHYILSIIFITESMRKVHDKHKRRRQECA